MKNIEAKAIIKNRPDYPLSKYVVAKAICGELWFWGTWPDENEAMRIAKQFDNGCVMEIENAGRDNNL